MTPSRFRLLLVFSALAICVHSFAQDIKPADVPAELAAAEQLYKSGKFVEAAEKYQAILKSQPRLTAAQVGSIRSLLREDKVDDAFAAASSDVSAEPDNAALQAAMGDVRFRRGEMAAAETAYLKALKLDSGQVRAYLGLARIYRAYSLYRHAYDELQEAHKIAPDDPDVRRAWLGQLPRKERIAALEAYLAAPHPDSPEETQRLQHTLDFLKATAEKPVHACKLVSKVEQTDTKLEPMLRDPTHLVGYGLNVRLNDHNAKLLLDTGASGIMVGRKAAEKAGLTRVSSMSIAGIGDKGLQSGYFAVADHIKVGELEFADCVVAVSDRPSVADDDGLIGGDVFSSYLIDIDMPAQKLRLSPLPKRPDEAVAPTSLDTEGESPSTSEEKKESADEQQGASGDKTAAKPHEPHLPHDRYVAPEMEKWTVVFRFGSHLLIPTRINDSPSMLFMIDTGANINIISKDAASQVTKVRSDPYGKVKGVNGSVNEVYRAQKATLFFGSHFAQKNQDMVSLDLSGLSRRMGTELSGALGFSLLHMVQLKIDYRDGLVDFLYDANRWNR